MKNEIKNLIILDCNTNSIVEVLIEGEHIDEIERNGIEEFVKSRKAELGISNENNCKYMLTDKIVNRKTVTINKPKFNICVDYRVNGIVTDSLIVEARNEDEAISIVKNEIENGNLMTGNYNNSIIDLETNFQYDSYDISEKENNVTIYPRGEYDKIVNTTYKPEKK